MGWASQECERHQAQWTPYKKKTEDWYYYENKQAWLVGFIAKLKMLWKNDTDHKLQKCNKLQVRIFDWGLTSYMCILTSGKRELEDKENESFR